MEASSGIRNHLRKTRRLEWIAFFTSAVLVLFMLFVVAQNLKEHPELSSPEVLLELALLMLPAFASALLGLFQKYWWLIPLGFWHIVLGIAIATDEILFYSFGGFVIIGGGTILLFMPFINKKLKEQ